MKTYEVESEGFVAETFVWQVGAKSETEARNIVEAYLQGRYEHPRMFQVTRDWAPTGRIPKVLFVEDLEEEWEGD